jgi:hypothetical protein
VKFYSIEVSFQPLLNDNRMDQSFKVFEETQLSPQEKVTQILFIEPLIATNDQLQCDE